MGLHPDATKFLLRGADVEAGKRVEPQAEAEARHFLVISAPFGPFSKELARVLRRQGARCTRVILNGGDVYDWGFSHASPYFGELSGWCDWLRAKVQRDGVTDLILYGDSNPYCAAAKQVAASLSLDVHVLEQGYFRPFWITLERDGVNGNSRLHRDPDAYRTAAATTAPVAEVWLAPLTPSAVYRISAYHISLYLTALFFPSYRLPYTYSAPLQMAGHIRRFVERKLSQSRHEQRLAAALDASGPLFLGLLQRPGDSQLLRHSPFPSAATFIPHVIESFARHAPEGARLIFKSHPLDPGLEPHATTVARAAAVWGVTDRVFFTDIGDLEKMLPKASGVVTINSTAGLTAVEHGCPTTVLGIAIYDMPGLTHQEGLDQFWTRPEKPDHELYKAFRRVVMASTQVNGAYASRRGVQLAAPEVARRLLAV